MTETKFLSALCGRRVAVTVFLRNGYQLHGIIESFGDTMLFVREDGMQKAIYKHAISTIVPEREV